MNNSSETNTKCRKKGKLVKYKPHAVLIDVTSACNLKCIHCRATFKSSQNELTKNEIFEIIDQCRRYWKDSISWISFGGGEPLLKKGIYPIKTCHLAFMRMRTVIG